MAIVAIVRLHVCVCTLSMLVLCSGNQVERLKSSSFRSKVKIEDSIVLSREQATCVLARSTLRRVGDQKHVR
jgi:hypothetical protein